MLTSIADDLRLYSRKPGLDREEVEVDEHIRERRRYKTLVERREKQRRDTALRNNINIPSNQTLLPHASTCIVCRPTMNSVVVVIPHGSGT